MSDRIEEIKEGLRNKMEEFDAKDAEIYRLKAELEDAIFTAQTELGAERERAEQAEKDRDEYDRDLEKEIATRDKYEDVIAEIAAILGCEDEWTNVHDHTKCIYEYAEMVVTAKEKAERELAEARERLNKINAILLWPSDDAEAPFRSLPPSEIVERIKQAIKAAQEGKCRES